MSNGRADCVETASVCGRPYQAPYTPAHQSGEANKILLDVRKSTKDERTRAKQVLSFCCGELRRVLHDELIGQAEVDYALSGDNDVTVAGGTGKHCASACA